MSISWEVSRICSYSSKTRIFVSVNFLGLVHTDLGRVGMWRLPDQALAEAGEVSLTGPGAAGWPGRVHTPAT